ERERQAPPGGSGVAPERDRAYPHEGARRRRQRRKVVGVDDPARQAEDRRRGDEPPGEDDERAELAPPPREDGREERRDPADDCEREEPAALISERVVQQPEEPGSPGEGAAHPASERRAAGLPRHASEPVVAEREAEGA